MLTPAHLRGLAIIAYAFGAAVVFDGVDLLLAFGLGLLIFGLTAKTIPRGSVLRYRLELRRPGGVQVLAATEDAPAGHAAFQTHAVQLEAAGATGQLVLVEVATRHPITWQVLNPRAGERGSEASVRETPASAHTKRRT